MENIFLEIDFTDFAFRILLRVYYANNARGKFWLRMCVCVCAAPTYASVRGVLLAVWIVRTALAEDTHTHKYIHIYIHKMSTSIFKFIQNTLFHTVQFTVLRKIISKHCGCAVEHDQKSNIFEIHNEVDYYILELKTTIEIKCK